MTYANLLRLYDRQALEGRHYAVKTRWLADLTPEIISAVVSAGATRTSSFSVIALHHFHGPGAQVAPDATAFGLRREHFLMEIVAAWDPSWKEDGAVHRQWASDLSSLLAAIRTSSLRVMVGNWVRLTETTLNGFCRSSSDLTPTAFSTLPYHYLHADLAPVTGPRRPPPRRGKKT
jgi:hypothetical protein